MQMRGVTDLGAGVMGAQTAAYCINARVRVILFDIAHEACWIGAANCDTDLPWLAECDVVIHAIGEGMDWKRALCRFCALHLRADAPFAANTSGPSIGALSKGFDSDLHGRFCGAFLFNPTRDMTLIKELA